jgi:hypothetical protein
MSQQSENSIYAFERKWFYRLKEGLLASLTDDEKMNSMIFAFVNPEGKRFYSKFENYIEFVKLLISLPQEKRCFHEVVIEHHPTKMIFDLDIKRFLTYENQIQEEIKQEQVQEFLEELISSIVLQYQEFGINLSLEKNFLLFSSHGKEKWSYHLLVDGYYCDNHHEAFEVYKRVFQRIQHPKKFEWMDGSVYSVNHCFRTLGSVKEKKELSEESRVKILETKWKFQSEAIEFQYSETPRNDKHKLVLEFERSFLTLTESCFPIPNLVVKQNAKEGLGSSSEMTKQPDEDILTFAFRLFQSMYGVSCFQYGGNMNNIILLIRKEATGCPICERVHEKENAFLWLKECKNENQVLSKYEVYFDCRRSNGIKIKLGEKTIIDSSIVPKDQIVEEKKAKVGFRLKDIESVSRCSMKKLKI